MTRVMGEVGVMDIHTYIHTYLYSLHFELVDVSLGPPPGLLFVPHFGKAPRHAHVQAVGLFRGGHLAVVIVSDRMRQMC